MNIIQVRLMAQGPNAPSEAFRDATCNKSHDKMLVQSITCRDMIDSEKLILHHFLTTHFLIAAYLFTHSCYREDIDELLS